MDQHGSNPAATHGISRQQVVVFVFVTLAVALPLLSYPLSLLPSCWASHRFDFRLPLPELAAIALLAALLRRPREPLHLLSEAEPPVLAMLALVFAQMLSALINDTEGRLAWMLRSICNLLLALSAAHFLRAEGLKRVAEAWTVAAVAQAVFVLLQAACGIEEVGTIGNRNFVAGYLALSLPIGIACLVSRARLRPPLSTGWLVGWMWVFNYAAVVLAAITLTRSRGAAAALGLVAAGWGIRRLKPPARRLACGVAIIAVAAAAFSPALLQSLKTQCHLDVRPAIWLGTVHAIADAPLVGHGPGSFVRAYPAYRLAAYFDRPKAAPVTDHAHNEFLETAAETGLIGLAAFLAVIVIGARTARRATAQQKDPALRTIALGMTLGLATLLVHNLLDINLRMPPNQTLCWIGLGWIGAAAGLAHSGEAVVFTYDLRRFARLLAGAVLLFLLALGVVRPAAGDWFHRQGLIAAAREPERALHCFLWSTSIDPDRIEGWRQLGLTAFRLGRMPLALQAMQTAHALAPDYANLNGEVGSLLAMQGRHAEAAVLLARATQLYPRDATNFAKLARVLLALNRPQPARAALDSALRLDPENPVAKLVAKEMAERSQP